MAIPTISEFAVDLDARRVRHVSGVVVTYHEYPDEQIWLLAGGNVENSGLYRGPIDDLLYMAKEAAIKAGMSHSRP